MAVIALSVASTVSSLPQSETERWFYSDATYTTEVGYRYTGCSGYKEGWGVTSNYRITYAENCSTGITICDYCYFDNVTATWHCTQC
ncbi:MAG TPA: DUF6289 family protein [Thermoanaerobaculia bacterium]|nr:DUF6289 family protein [Thermoanaerobaculia bacterium]